MGILEPVVKGEGQRTYNANLTSNSVTLFGVKLAVSQTAPEATSANLRWRLEDVIMSLGMRRKAARNFKKYSANKPDDIRTVVRILITNKSMPFLELAAVSELDHGRLRKAVEKLAEFGLVKIVNPDSLVDEIVTLKETGLDMVRERFAAAG